MPNGLDALARIQEASFTRASATTRAAFPEARRMDGPALRAFLSHNRIGVLATTRADGRPHAAPIGFALVGSRFVFASLANAARVSNLAAQPYASLVVQAGGADTHAVVIAEGTARAMEPMSAPMEMREPFRSADGSLPAWAGVLIVLTPERLMSYRTHDPLDAELQEGEEPQE